MLTLILSVIKTAILLGPLYLASALQDEAAEGHVVGDTTQEALTALYFDAVWKESGLRDLKAAAEAYADLVVRAKDGVGVSTALIPKNDRKPVPGAYEDDLAIQQIRVQALMGQARCLRHLGQVQKANELLQQAQQIDPYLEALLLDIQRMQRDLNHDVELAERIRALIQEMNTQNSEQAKSSLKALGEVAVPFLAESLRSRDVSVVQGATELLIQMKKPEVEQILADSLEDPEVVLPAIMAKSMARQHAFISTIGPWKAIVSHPSDQVRGAIIRNYAKEAHRYSVAESLEVAEALFESENPQLRREVFANHFPPHLLTLSDLIQLGLVDEDDRVRRSALYAVQKILTDVEVANEAEAYLPYVFKLMGDEDDQFAADACDVAVLMTKQEWGRDMAPSLLAELLRNEQIPAACNLVWLHSDSWSEENENEVLVTVGRVIEGEIPADYFVVNGKKVRDMNRSFMQFLANVSESWSERASPKFLADLLIALEQAPFPDMRPTSTIRANLVFAAMDHYAGDIDAKREWLRRVFGRTDDPDLEEDLIKSYRAAFSTRYPEDWALLASSSNPSTRRFVYRILVGNAQRPGSGIDAPLAVPSEVVADFPYMAEDLSSSQNQRLFQDAYEVAVLYALPQWSEAITRLIESEDPDVSPLYRSGVKSPFAILAVAQGKDSIETLRTGLERSDSVERLAAASALLSVSGVDAAADLAASAIEQGSARTYASLVRHRADVLRRYLEAMPDSSLDQWFFESLHGSDNNSVLDRKQLERFARIGLESDDPQLQIMGSEAAHEGALESMLPLLAAHLDSSFASVRQRAAVAYDSIRQHRERIQASSIFGSEGRMDVIRRAMVLVQDEDPQKRQGGALALGVMGDPAVVPVLLDLLEDDVESVREAALDALEKIGGKAEEKDS